LWLSQMGEMTCIQNVGGDASQKSGTGSSCYLQVWKMWLKLIALILIWIGCWLIERDAEKCELQTRNERREGKIWPLCTNSSVHLLLSLFVGTRKPSV
jgi:hypothetical protein